MEGTELAALASAAVSLLLQILKDSLPVGSGGKRWLATALGAIAGASAGYIGGGQAVAEIIGNAGLSAVFINGIHVLLLKDAWLGQALKNILGAKD